jgi:hypothetical protein
MVLREAYEAVGEVGGWQYYHKDLRSSNLLSLHTSLLNAMIPFDEYQEGYMDVEPPLEDITLTLENRNYKMQDADIHLAPCGCMSSLLQFGDRVRV